MARPTCVALFPCWSTSSTSPTITSGPGTRAGAFPPSACCSGGITIDLGVPFTNWVISIGCIATPMEISPPLEPASDGRPRTLANMPVHQMAPSRVASGS